MYRFPQRNTCELGGGWWGGGGGQLGAAPPPATQIMWLFWQNAYDSGNAALGRKHYKIMLFARFTKLDNVVSELVTFSRIFKISFRLRLSIEYDWLIIEYFIRCGNVFVFHAIWVLLYPNFNTVEFGRCVNFFGWEVHCPPPSPPAPPPLNSEGALVPVLVKVQHLLRCVLFLHFLVLHVTIHKDNPNSVNSPGTWKENLWLSCYLLVQLLWWETHRWKMEVLSVI